MQHIVASLNPQNTQLAPKEQISPEQAEDIQKLQKLYALRDELEKKQQLKERENETLGQTAARYAGHGVRTAIGGAADLADIPRIPLNIARFVTGNEIPESFGELARRKFDEKTGKKYRPLTDTGELADLVSSSLAGMGGLGAAGKLLNTVGKLPRVGAALKHGNEFNFRNVGGTAGSVTAADSVIKNNPEDPLAAILAGIAGGSAGGSGAYMLRHPVQSTEKITKGIRNHRLHAAIRHPDYGHGIAEALPDLYGFEKGTEIPYEKVGVLGKKAATSLENKKSTHFENTYGQLREDFNKIATDPEHRMVDLKPVMDFIVQKYVQDFSKDKSTQDIFFKGPLGREASRILGIPQEHLSPRIMHNLAESGLPSIYTQMDIDALFTNRKHLDSLIKSPEWLHVGADKNGLTHIRGLMDEIREQGYERLNPELAKRLRSTNSDYKSYLENEAQYLNRISEQKADHAGIYEKSKNDLGKAGKDLEYTLAELAPEERETYLQRVLWDLGRHEGNVSSKKLLSNFNSLEPSVQKQILAGLQEQKRGQVEDLLSAQKGYGKITKDNQTGADTAMRAHGIGKWATTMHQQFRKLYMLGLNNPEGRKKAVQTMIEEGRAIPENRAHNISPIDSLPKTGVSKYSPDFINKAVKKAVDSPGFIQQVGKSFEGTKRTPFKIDTTEEILVP